MPPRSWPRCPRCSISPICPARLYRRPRSCGRRSPRHHRPPRTHSPPPRPYLPPARRHRPSRPRRSRPRPVRRGRPPQPVPSRVCSVGPPAAPAASTPCRWHQLVPSARRRGRPSLPHTRSQAPRGMAWRVSSAAPRPTTEPCHRRPCLVDCCHSSLASACLQELRYAKGSPLSSASVPARTMMRSVRGPQQDPRPLSPAR